MKYIKREVSSEFGKIVSFEVVVEKDLVIFVEFNSTDVITDISFSTIFKGEYLENSSKYSPLSLSQTKKVLTTAKEVVEKALENNPNRLFSCSPTTKSRAKVYRKWNLPIIIYDDLLKG